MVENMCQDPEKPNSVGNRLITLNQLRDLDFLSACMLAGDRHINHRGQLPPYFLGSLISSLIWMLHSDLRPEAAPRAAERMESISYTAQHSRRKGKCWHAVWILMSLYSCLFWFWFSFVCGLRCLLHCIQHLRSAPCIWIQDIMLLFVSTAEFAL